MIEHSEKFEELPKALLLVQRAITKAIKNADNPFTKKKYADIEAIIEAVKSPLNDNDISFIQYTVSGEENKTYLETALLHKDGEYVVMKMPVIFAKEKDPQSLGSGLTYAKRYSLQALLGLPTADDDGEGAKRGNKAHGEIPAPNEKQMEFINTVWDKLADSAPEGMRLNVDKVGKFIYACLGEYPDDLKRVSGTVGFILGTAEKSKGKNQIATLCDIQE